MDITNSEWKIMEFLWKTPMTITQLTNALKEDTGWTKHTVIALLKRMLEKNTVYFEEGGKAKIFYPKISREEATSKETTELLSKAFSGRASLFLNALVEKEALSERDINEICELLNLQRKD